MGAVRTGAYWSILEDFSAVNSFMSAPHLSSVNTFILKWIKLRESLGSCGWWNCNMNVSLMLKKISEAIILFVIIQVCSCKGDTKRY